MLGLTLFDILTQNYDTYYILMLADIYIGDNIIFIFNTGQNRSWLESSKVSMAKVGS